jgi:hypothetical protein
MGWLRAVTSTAYDAKTGFGWFSETQSFRPPTSLRYRFDTNDQKEGWIDATLESPNKYPAMAQLLNSFRHVRIASLYLDGERKPTDPASVGGGSSAQAAAFDPTYLGWGIDSQRPQRAPYWRLTEWDVDWIRSDIEVLDPSTHAWSMESGWVYKRKSDLPISWTRTGWFVSLYHDVAREFDWTVNSQRVPGIRYWTSPSPATDFLTSDVISAFNPALEDRQIDSQRVPHAPYWTSQWFGNEWVNPALLAQIAFNPAQENWHIQSGTYKKRGWWSDRPQEDAWLVPSAVFDRKLWPATKVDSQRLWPKAVGRWQPDLDNAWQFTNPVVVNLFNASFVASSNQLDDAGGSPIGNQ